jgi:hypothetical protein
MASRSGHNALITSPLRQATLEQGKASIKPTGGRLRPIFIPFSSHFHPIFILALQLQAIKKLIAKGS